MHAPPENEKLQVRHRRCAATSREICFPFHSIARRVYFTAAPHHVGTDKYLSKILRSRGVTFFFFFRALLKSYGNSPADVLLKFLKLCVSETRDEAFARLFKFPRGSQPCGSYVFTGKMLSEKKKTERELELSSSSSAAM